MLILSILFKFLMVMAGLTVVTFGVFFAMALLSHQPKYSVLGQKREKVNKMFPDLKINKSISGKFGIVIEGTFDNTYFKAICDDCDGEVTCRELLCQPNDEQAIIEALVWCGYIDCYEDDK